MNKNPTGSSSRPWWLRLLAFGLLLLSLTGWLRLEQTLLHWNSLVQAGIQPGPLYLAVYGAVIGASALAACLAIWLRKRRAPLLAMAALLCWLVWLWLDRLWIARSPAARTNSLFLIIASGIILFAAAFALRRGRDQFR